MPILRLINILHKYYIEYRGYSQLSKAIDAANNRKNCIDRRKLKQIIESAPGKESFTISLDDLEAIHVFLRSRGQGEDLSEMPLFEHENLLRSVSSGGLVEFYTFAHALKGRHQLSSWDVRALAEMIRGMNRVMPDIRLDLQNKLVWQGDGHLDQVDLAQQLPAPKCAVCCIGGMLSCHLTDYLMDLMFPITAPLPVDRWTQLPFSLALDPSRPSASLRANQRPSSRFAIQPENIRKDHFEFEDKNLPGKIMKGAAKALVVGRRVFPVEYGSKKGHKWKDYGVIAAQRRESGQVWLVVWGVSGPGTYAAALGLEMVRAGVPNDRNKNSRVLYAVVEIDVQLMSDDDLGDYREAQNPKIIEGPYLWPKDVCQ